jgi:uncharacterized protein YqiB (DUF1249 family)
MLHNASLNDSLALVSWRARPRSFVALMGLYESNYVRFNWLTTGVAGLEGAHRSVVADDCDLLLTVTERTPYTSTVNLSYSIAEDLQIPDLRVRVYHDAHLAEAQEWAGTHTQSVLKALRSQAERELDQRWARNVMLNKWLEYCVERGHRFSSATRIVAGS